MKIICRSLVFVLVGVAVLAGRARAAGSPLLVAVEVAPGVDIRPRDVRETVASELGTPVIGARDPTPAEDVLLVALEPREIRMSLHARAAPVVTRAIEAPADRPGRLRSIAWLAGNLVRDQVGPIVASDGNPPPAVTAPTNPLLAADPLTATEPPALQAAEPAGAAAPPRQFRRRPRVGRIRPRTRPGRSRRRGAGRSPFRRRSCEGYISATSSR